MTVALSTQPSHHTEISTQLRSLAIAAGDRIDDARMALEESLSLHRTVLANSASLRADRSACLTWKSHIVKLEELLTVLSDLY